MKQPEGNFALLITRNDKAEVIPVFLHFPGFTMLEQTPWRLSFSRFSLYSVSFLIRSDFDHWHWTIFCIKMRRGLLCTIFCHLMKNQLQMAVVVRCTRVVKKVDIDIFVVVNLKENDVTTTWKGRATLHSSRTREETPVGCRNPKVGLRNRSKSGSNGRSLLMTKFCSSPILGLRPHGYPQATVPHPNVPTTTSSEFDKNNLGKPSSPIDTASLNTLSTQGSQLSTVW